LISPKFNESVDNNAPKTQEQILKDIASDAQDGGIDLIETINITKFNSLGENAQSGKLYEIKTRYSNWLSLGYQGHMKFLETHKDLKFYPEAILPSCTHLVIVAMNYYQPAPWESGRLLASDSTNSTELSRAGRIARYAWGRDYHKVLPKKLKTIGTNVFGKSAQGIIWRVLVDANPLDERFFAFNCGLGFTGRHTLTINHTLGSWFFLGTMLLNLSQYPMDKDEDQDEKSINLTEIDPYTIQGSTHQGSCPKSCFRCIQICPTGALKSPNVLDASRCISYLTIEHKGSIDVELRPLMGDWIFGCDLCQEVCPFNLKASITKVTDFLVKKAEPLEDLHNLLGLRTQEDFVEVFAGTPIMRAGRESMVRNAAIATGNRKNQESVPYLVKALEDQSPVVREHVQWALDQIAKNSTPIGTEDQI
jgi:epoxyqueuosine reductase